MGLIGMVFSCAPTGQEMLAIAERLFEAAGSPAAHVAVLADMRGYANRNWDGLVRSQFVALAYELGMEAAAADELRALSEQRAALSRGAIPEIGGRLGWRIPSL